MEPVLERVQSVVRREVAGLPVRVFLFGSWAGGRPGRASDIDLGVLGAAGGLVARLREACDESDVPYPVEVVDLGAADEAFRKKVMGEGIEWTA